MSDPKPRPGPPASEGGADSDDGVDVSLIRWTLSLTPRERLEALQANVDALVRFQDAAASQR